MEQMNNLISGNNMGRKGLYILMLLLFLGSKLLAQQAIIQDQAEKYFDRNPEEKLFLHLSRPMALAGEDVYFRIFHVAANNHEPYLLSKVAYVELLDNDGTAIEQVRIEMDSAGGQGYLQLPATINSGYYVVRAYTQWMRNYDEARFFHAPLQVINTFKRLGLKAIPDSAALQISFFPEGGNFVDGVPVNSGVKIRNKMGKPVSVAGMLINAANEEIVPIRTDEFGIARIRLEPSGNTPYRFATVQDTIDVTLGPIESAGSVMEVKAVSGDYNVEVRTKDISENGTGYLAILASGDFISVTTSQPVNGTYVFKVKKSDLKPGVNQLTFFNSAGMPQNERLLFNTPSSALKLSLTTSKNSYNTGEDATISLVSAEIPADVSVSVYAWDENLSALGADIDTYFWLISELPGGIDLPKGYVSVGDPADLETIDKILLTHGWRRYDWNKIQNNESAGFLPEFRNPLITGNSSSGMKGERIFASMPGSDDKLFIADTGPDGRFFMEVPEISGEKEVILQGSSSGKLELGSYFDERKSTLTLPKFSVSKNLRDFLEAQNIHMQVRNYFMGENANDAGEGQAFYGVPDASYDLDNYTRFPVMEEVMREYVYGVYVRKRGDKFILRVYDESGDNNVLNDPLILLDGVPVFDADIIMDIDPLKIQKIDVVRRKYGYGPQVANGIIAFYSYKSDLAGYELPASALRSNYLGLQEKKQFYIPSESGSVKAPDLRNQVYWNPQVMVDGASPAELQFNLPDNAGTFRIVVQGMGYNGEFGSTSYTFQVNRK